jgi:hypothetical protein
VRLSTGRHCVRETHRRGGWCEKPGESVYFFEMCSLSRYCARVAHSPHQHVQLLQAAAVARVIRVGTAQEGLQVVHVQAHAVPGTNAPWAVHPRQLARAPLASSLMLAHLFAVHVPLASIQGGQQVSQARAAPCGCRCIVVVSAKLGKGQGGQVVRVCVRGGVCQLLKRGHGFV